MTREQIERAGLWANLPAREIKGTLDEFEAGKRAAVEAMVRAAEKNASAL